jgi:hypothetical protein
MKYLENLPVETRSGYLGMAFDLKMDRLSLRLRAILRLLQLDPKKARSFWGEMDKPMLAPLKCEDTLVYDVSDYYDAMMTMARRAFTSEEMRNGEEFRFVDSHIVNIHSPVEVIEAALAIKDFKVTTLQFGSLVETYSRALKNVAKDNRAFWVKSDNVTATVLALAAEAERRLFPSDFLIGHYRDYLAGQLGAPRCADNLIRDGKSAGAPKFVTELNQALKSYDYIPKITDNDIVPRKIDRPAMFSPYWRTPRARGLFEKVSVLRFGKAPPKEPRKSDKPPTPLSFETRQSSQWQYQLSDFLREMAQWKPEHEASAADYFHQKCRLFNELIELAPNSSMRLVTTAEYMAFLERNRFERDSFIEWYLHVSDLLRRIRVMEEEEKKLALDALRYSNDHVLQLCVKLIPALEAAAQASR